MYTGVHLSACNFCPIFIRLWFCWQILVKTPSSRNNRPVGAEFYHVGWQTDGRTDRHDEANSAVRKFANASEVAVSIMTASYQTGFFFNVLLTVHPCIICFKRSQLGAHCFLVHLFQLLLFVATMSPSSGELTLSMRHWHFSLCMGDWLVGMRHPNQQTSQPPIQREKYQCRLDTVRSPDVGHIVTRNM
jgi:hypothetical protein